MEITDSAARLSLKIGSKATFDKLILATARCELQR